MAGTSPPASLVLVHGAGSGPWVFDGWAGAFPSLAVVAVDLQSGLDVAEASMDDYARKVVTAAGALPPPVALCGWSMGGLVVLQAAHEVRPHSVVLLEASAPAEIQGHHSDVALLTGVFDPEAEYGAFPAGIRARPESLLARAQRRRGIAIPGLPCPSLVIAGAAFANDRGRALADVYQSTFAEFPELQHFDLVLDAAPRQAIAAFLGVSSGPTA